MNRAFPTKIEWVTRYIPRLGSGLLFNQAFSHFLRFGLLALRSRFISQPLAFDASQGAVGSRAVANAKRNTVAVTKINSARYR
jgi:hypothetical protein